jgi:hypothetical protein
MVERRRECRIAISPGFNPIRFGDGANSRCARKHSFGADRMSIGCLVLDEARAHFSTAAGRRHTTVRDCKKFAGQIEGNICCEFGRARKSSLRKIYKGVCCGDTSKARLLCQRRRRRRVRPEKIYSGIDWPLLVVARRAVGGLDDRSSVVQKIRGPRLVTPRATRSSFQFFILPS